MRDDRFETQRTERGWAAMCDPAAGQMGAAQGVREQQAAAQLGEGGRSADRRGEAVERVRDGVLFVCCKSSIWSSSFRCTKSRSEAAERRFGEGASSRTFGSPRAGFAKPRRAAEGREPDWGE